MDDESETIEVEVPKELADAIDNIWQDDFYLHRGDFLRSVFREAVASTGVVTKDDQERTVRQFIALGLSPPRAVDYYFVEVEGYSASEWADVRGTSPQAINQNVRRAKEDLSELESNRENGEA
jgi:DNA-directed RNA polymerase specialized sigma24 family protein